ncbi:MAG: DUF2079 domain-containing protein [Propionibacteriaceae bacterium]|nr:DUF2079 domain-containing protein [Propionibacteriaceae bacterium]
MPIMVIRTPHIVAASCAALTALAYGVLAYQQWTTGWVPSWDLGIFSQLAKAYAHGEVPIVPIKGEGFNLLGDHFHPILVLLGLVWAVWPSGLALLMTQAVLFGVSAYPFARYATERYGAGFGAVVGIGYGLSWGLQTAATSQFHEIAFAVPMFAFGLVAFLEQRWLASVLWIGALVFVKEDMGLTVTVFGAVLWGRHLHSGKASVWPRNREQRMALGLAAWGLGWLVLSTAVILPALNPGQRYDYTDRLTGIGASLGHSETYIALVMLVCAAGIIGLRSPLSWLMVPTLAWRLAGNVSYYWGWEWHYSATLMPIAVAALLDQVRRWSSEDGPSAAGARVRWLAACILIVSTIWLGGKQPIARLGQEAFWDTWRAPGMAAALRVVPSGATVLTDIGLMAYLVPERTVYWVGTPHPTPDYVVRNAQSIHWEQSAITNLADWASERFGQPYEIVHDAEHYVIARRVS